MLSCWTIKTLNRNSPKKFCFWLHKCFCLSGPLFSYWVTKKKKSEKESKDICLSSQPERNKSVFVVTIHWAIPSVSSLRMVYLLDDRQTNINELQNQIFHGDLLENSLLKSDGINCLSWHSLSQNCSLAPVTWKLWEDILETEKRQHALIKLTSIQNPICEWWVDFCFISWNVKFKTVFFLAYLGK